MSLHGLLQSRDTVYLSPPKSCWMVVFSYKRNGEKYANRSLFCCRQIVPA